jgi:hypothetical protein
VVGVESFNKIIHESQIRNECWVFHLNVWRSHRNYVHWQFVLIFQSQVEIEF